ncbi:MAG: 2-phospho-L-lactate transferase [Halobacteriales archaeon]
MIDGPVTVLGGGTGTPKLLTAVEADATPPDLTVVANTGDDVEFGDLFVCPDVDSCLFAAAGLLDDERWWGIADDTEATARQLADLAADLGLDGTPAYRPAPAQTAGRRLSRWRRFEPLPEFMTLGDRDRAIHRVRAHLLDRGLDLTAVTRRLAAALGVGPDVVPMSDDPVATIVSTDEGPMHFQAFWVARGGDPAVEGVDFRGLESAAPSPAVLDALDGGVAVVGPSNPVTSLGPILGLPGVRERLHELPTVAVSPFLGEAAFSGPAVELMAALDLPVGTPGLEAAYPFVDAVVLDASDPTELDVPTLRGDIRIDGPDDAARVWGLVEAALEAVA